MKFHLVYNGQLPASGNKPKPEFVRRIRDQIHPQMKYLWETSGALKRLKRTSVVSGPGMGSDLSLTNSPFQDDRPLQPLRPGQVDLCGPISLGNRSFQPLVTQALHTNCSLSILFLRQEDPGSLVLQGGDLDNRIKTLCDGLKMPSAEEAAALQGGPDPTYCLLESDSLIAGLEVQTDRLLFPQSDHPHEVHLVIEVEVRVLRVGPWNVALL